MSFKLSKSNIAKLQKNPIEFLNSLTENDIVSLLQQANYHYRNKESIISDTLYDMVHDHLEKINPNHPILKNIGAAVADDDRKVKLPVFMGSLNKIKADDTELEKFKNKYPGRYTLADKLDGNSALLTHDTDKNLKLFTRGDGSVGQDISHIIPFINGILPLVRNIRHKFIIRGELIISKINYETYLKTKGPNARNIVSGFLNAKIPDLEIAKLTDFVAYEMVYPEHTPLMQYDEIIELGFNPVHTITVTEEELTTGYLSELLMNRRVNSPYEIDGIVVTHDGVHKRAYEENPTYAFAFKSILMVDQAEVVVLQVEYNMSKDGILVPVVNFTPITLDGVKISRAHGFNAKFIQDNKIGPGSKLVIIRSGLVIPYIEKVLSPSETGEGQMPDVPYTWSKTGVDAIADSENNAELLYKQFENFFNKIDVKNLSSGTLIKIYNAEINTVQKLFAATIEDLIKVPGIKDKTANNIVTALRERKSTLDCITIMEASNTIGRGFGRKKIEMILNSNKDIVDKRYIPTIKELVSIKGIEATTADAFVSNLPTFWKFVDDNNLLSVACASSSSSSKQKATTQQQATTTLSGKKFVFTGFRDKALEEKIISLGGQITTSVSKNTTAVVAKVQDAEKDSGKVLKAKELNIPVYDVEEFKKIYSLL